MIEILDTGLFWLLAISPSLDNPKQEGPPDEPFLVLAIVSCAACVVVKFLVSLKMKILKKELTQERMLSRSARKERNEALEESKLLKRDYGRAKAKRGRVGRNPFSGEVDQGRGDFARATYCNDEKSRREEERVYRDGEAVTRDEALRIEEKRGGHPEPPGEGSL